MAWCALRFVNCVVENSWTWLFRMLVYLKLTCNLATTSRFTIHLAWPHPFLSDTRVDPVWWIPVDPEICRFSGLRFTFTIHAQDIFHEFCMFYCMVCSSFREDPFFAHVLNLSEAKVALLLLSCSWMDCNIEMITTNRKSSRLSMLGQVQKLINLQFQKETHVFVWWANLGHTQIPRFFSAFSTNDKTPPWVMGKPTGNQVKGWVMTVKEVPGREVLAVMGNTLKMFSSKLGPQHANMFVTSNIYRDTLILSHHSLCFTINYGNWLGSQLSFMTMREPGWWL